MHADLNCTAIFLVSWINLVFFCFKAIHCGFCIPFFSSQKALSQPILPGLISLQWTDTFCDTNQLLTQFIVHSFSIFIIINISLGSPTGKQSESHAGIMFWSWWLIGIHCCTIALLGFPQPPETLTSFSLWPNAFPDILLFFNQIIWFNPIALIRRTFLSLWLREEVNILLSDESHTKT